MNEQNKQDIEELEHELSEALERVHDLKMQLGELYALEEAYHAD